MAVEGSDVGRTLVGIGLGAAILASLASCASEQHAATASQSESSTPSWSGPAMSEVPSPDASPSAGSASEDSYVAPPVKTDECHEWVFAANDNPEQVAGWAIQVGVDSGPRENANGTATLDTSGTPVAYKVASGDVFEIISRRFCINDAYLYAINSVRRKDIQLYVGDTINLDSHTIFTVGNENGVVYDKTPPSPIPPQH